jgi:signal transduction histidine kinase
MNVLQFSTASFGLTSLALAFFIPFFGNKAIHRYWALFNVFVFLWGVCLFLIATIGPNRELAHHIWIVAGVVGMSIALIFLKFVNTFCQRSITWLDAIFYAVGIGFIVLLGAGAFRFTLVYLHDTYYYVLVNFPLYHALAWFWIATSLYAHYLLYRRLQVVKGEEKIQLQYMFIAVFVAFFSGGAAHWLAAYGLPIHPAWNFFITIYTLLFTYAIFRHRLLGLDPMLRKGLVYTLMITLISAFYYVSIFLLGASLEDRHKALVILIISFLIADPIRRRLQTSIDRFFYKGSLEEIAEENELLGREIQKQDELRAIATFAAGMAHEIKNPLTAIKTFTEALPARRGDDAFIQKFQSIVSGEVNKIDEIVRNVLNFARPSQAQTTNVSLESVVESVLALLEAEFVKASIKVSRRYSCDFTILGDTKQLQQAILNVLKNAIEAIPNGGEIDIVLFKDGNDGVIEVHDTGTGIAPEHMKLVFEPFFTTKTAGTGLGLSIVHGIFAAHGAHTNITSRQGKTTFTIRFPDVQPR